MSSKDKQNFNTAKECHFFINSRGFPVSVLHWDQKDRRYGLKSGSGTHLVNGETKDHILAEASAHFKLQGQILVFQDGTEVPHNFNLRSYTLEKKIRFPSRVKAGDKLYLLHVSERKGICSNIYNHNFLEDLQYFDDKMDDFAFDIVNFRNIWTCTT